MIYVLNRKFQVASTFLNNGAPGACPYFDDLLKESVALGAASYEFRVPADHPATEHLTEGAYVVRKDLEGNDILFQVMRVEEKHATDRYIYAYTETAGLELLNDIIRPAPAPSTVTADQAFGYILADTNWVAGKVDYAGVEEVEFKDYENALASLQRVAKQFELELIFRVEMKLGRVVSRIVDVVEERGSRTYKRFEYNKDINDITRTVDISQVATAILPLGKGADSEPLTIKGVVWNTPTHPTNKESADDFLGDEDALERWGVDGKHITVQETFETEDKYHLADLAWKRLQELKDPLITYELDVALLERLVGEEYRHESVRIGDTVHVIDQTFESPLLLEARVVELETSFSDPTQDKCTLGNFILKKSNISPELRALQQKLFFNEATWAQIGETIIKEPTPPTAPVEGQLWVDTGREPSQLMVYRSGEWKPASPDSTYIELVVGEVDNKVDDVTERVDTVEQEVVAIEVKANTAQITAEEAQANADQAITGAQGALDAAQAADASAQAAKQRADEAYSSAQSKEAAIHKGTTAPTNPAAGKLWLDTSTTPNSFKRWSGSAWVKVTPTVAGDLNAYTVTEVNNALNAKVSTTTYTTDKEGIISRLDSTESSITQQAGEIASKVNQTDFNLLDGRVDAAESTILQQAGLIETKVSQIEYTKSLKSTKLPSLLTYYGYPVAVNNVWEVDAAASIFAQHDYIILGDTYQEPTQEVYAETVAIIAKVKELNPETTIFGYIPLGMSTNGRSMATLKTAVDQWETAGAHGIFVDEFGFDYRNTRERQNEIVDYIHAKGMPAFANSWEADYVFSDQNIYLDWLDFNGNPNNLPTSIGANDFVMIESFVVNDWYAQNDERNGFMEKWAHEGYTKWHGYRKTFGTKILAQTIIDETKPLFTSKIDVGTATAALYSLDGIGFARTDFGASNPQLFDYVTPTMNMGNYYDIEQDVIHTSYNGEFYQKHIRVTDKGEISVITDDVNKFHSATYPRVDIFAEESAKGYTDKTFEPLEQRLTLAETSITQNADSISLKANQTVVDGIDTRLSAAETKITPAAITNTVRSSALYVNDQERLKEYVQSRGENLVTNGTGLLGDNTNFLAATFDASDAYNTNGSFTYVGEWDGPVSKEFIPVNVDKTYRFKYYAKANPMVGSPVMYGYVQSFDADGNAISPIHTMYLSGTTTTLAATLSPGATTVQLTSAANWNNGGDGGYQRAFIFWNYVNEGGYAWPTETYSRNYYSDWWNAGGINYSTNTITLNKPWTGPTIAAGTPVSNGTSGGALKYIAGAYSPVTAQWQAYEGTMGGIDTSGQNNYNKFHPGTASVKIGWLCNVNSPTSKTWLSNISFEIDYGGQISGLGTRLTQAEQKITDSAIVNTVTSSTVYQNDIQGLEDGISGLDIRVQEAEQKITAEAITSSVLDSQSFLDVLGAKVDAETLAAYATSDSLGQMEILLKAYADGKISDIDFSPYVTSTELTQTKDEFDFLIKSGGGVNLLKNSVGWADDADWALTGSGDWDVLKDEAELDSVGSGAAWRLNARTLTQEVAVRAGNEYTFSCMAWKTATKAGMYLEYDDGSGTFKSGPVILTANAYNWEPFSYTFTAVGDTVKIRLRGAGASSDLKVANVMLNIGTLPMQWTHSAGEMYNTNIKFNQDGIIVKNNATNGETRITPTEFSGWARDEDGNQERIFTLNGDTTEVKKLQAEEQFAMGSMRILYIESTNATGWSFLPRQSEN